jgi:hypothetical protein
MRKIEILVTCDACAAWHQTDNSTDVATVPVSAGQTLDLCGSHRTDLAPFLALIAEWGQAPERNHGGRKRATVAVEATSAAVAPVEAPRAPNRRGGKRARQRRTNAQQGTPTALLCPLCSAPAASADSLGGHLRTQHQTTGQVVYGGVCPVCNHDGSPRGLGTHAGQAHGISSVAALFAVADSQGDPHGVVAARAAALAAAP